MSKRLLFMLLLCIATGAQAQTYVKMNALYALGGVVNPAVEFRISPKSTWQSEIVLSPWNSVTINGRQGPMRFGILMNEYRRYFRTHHDGWYLAANIGGMAFNMTKPYWDNGLQLQQKSTKGYGMMAGLAAGYQRPIGRRWVMDLYFGWAFMSSFYNGYALTDGLVEGEHTYSRGELILHPSRHEHDPFNGSAEWLPNKIGISFGYRIF
jgi:hypothetical protein